MAKSNLMLAKEQDADIVMFVHRPDAIGMGDTVEDKEYTEIIFAKNRNGQIGTIPMRFKGNQMRFVEDNDGLMSTFPSAMNDDAGVQGQGPSYDQPQDPFSQGPDFGAYPSSSNGEFQNSGF